MAEYSLADIKSVVDGEDRHDGVFGEGAFLWIILIFLFFLAFSGNGFFGNGNATTSSMAQVERDVLTTSCNTQKEVLQSNYNTLLGFKDQQLQISECCCENRLAIANQTNALATAIHAEGEATRALIQENTITDLRERLNTANNALTVQTITNGVIDAVRPYPTPAYITCSPFMSAYYGYGSGYGLYGSGCGCGSCGCNNLA